MAGNEWINSYLGAILDVGPPINDPKSSLLLRERGRFSPARYFVEEVITGFDETDLHRSWVRASSIRDSQERNTRLENMCWRIWNLTRKKKQKTLHLFRKVATFQIGCDPTEQITSSSILLWFTPSTEFKVRQNLRNKCVPLLWYWQLEGEEAQRVARRHHERERAHREAIADMSDLSDGEKIDIAGDLSGHGDSVRGKMSRVSSVDVMANWANQYMEKKLYIVLISLHGLIRGENMELGRDSDTGGQVKYVVELARALGMMPGVYRVDLLTRQVSAPDVDWTYGEPTEMINLTDSLDAMHEVGESGGAYIIRIPFGPNDKYIPKELLWPHIPEFVDGALSHIVQMSKVLGEQTGSGQPLWPVVIHGHYADAGESAALLSGALNVPMVLTGHSLGRDKLEQLLKQGRQPKEEINATYKIMRRIEAEELSLDVSEMIITSTRQEIEEQWNLYDGFDPKLERKLRARIKRNVSCYGRFMPHAMVIPPGMEFHHIVPHEGDMGGEAEGNEHNVGSADPPIWLEIMRFFTNPHKPMILALARPDPKKNLITLVKAFGECRQLRELANLTLVMGNRDVIDEMSSTNSSVLVSIIKLIDKYDLYGQVAYPKHHKQSDVPEIYRLAAKSKGVFINPAIIEPFGLTLIEAAAHGLPIVATKNGGPVDIHRVLDNGLLVDPHDQHSVADALLKLVADKQLWARCRDNGLRNIHLFSWPEHCKTYLARVMSCKQRQPRWKQDGDECSDSEPDSPGDSLRDIKDLSLSLSLSLDGDKNEKIGTSVTALDFVENASKKKSQLDNMVSTLPVNRSMEKAEQSKFQLSRRSKLIVIAVDCDTPAGLADVTQTIIETVKKDNTASSIGFILSTALTITEVLSFLELLKFKPHDFDAYICNSGGDVYYPCLNTEEKFSGPSFTVDSDYQTHIDYRWGGEDLRKTIIRWADSLNDKVKNKAEIAIKEIDSASAHCFSFRINDQSLVSPVKEVRRLLRIQALRCHAIYCQSGSRLNVIPVLASRSQALRYIFIRWGINLGNLVVFAGESGDTDYELLVGGLHKTVVLMGVCTEASKVHSNRNYPLEHVLPAVNSNIVECGSCSKEDISVALNNLGFSKE